MNVVQEIHRINAAELASGSNASWHDQYKDSAYIYVGGLPGNLTEGDVITIFSEYGEVVDVSLPRDAATQKTKGFAFLMYADQRSTVLAVDNLGGAKVLDRTLRVDHVLNYKQLERDKETGKMVERDVESLAAHPDKFRIAAPAGSQSPTSSIASSSYSDIDLDDPMRDYLIRERKEAKLISGDKGKSKKRVREGESKEEKKIRREEKRVAKEVKLKERENKKAKKLEGGSHGARRIEDGRDDRKNERRYSPRRDDRQASPRRDDRRDSEYRRDDDRRDSSRRDRDGGDRDGDRRSRDDRDSRDTRHSRDSRDRERDGGRSGGGSSSAFADLEKWAKR